MPTVLNMTSEFASCLIAVTSWAKLQSPIGQCLMLSFPHLWGVGSIFLMMPAAMIQSNEILFLSFLQIARATAIKCSKNTTKFFTL